MKSRFVRFPNAAGQQLAGLLDLPARPSAYALFAHCFTCTKNLKAASNISRALTGCGIAVLRFDFTGLGQSEGEFAATSFSSTVEDLLAASRYLEREHEPPAILVGHSLGGTAVLQAAPRIASSRAVATINSPSRASHVEQLLGSAREEIERSGEAEVRLGGRPFRIRKQFLDDLRQHPLPESLRGLRRPLLIFHSPADDTVDIDNASELFAHALHPKSFVSLDRADHLLSDPADSAYVGKLLAAWSGKYVGTEEMTAAEPLEAEEGTVVARTRQGSFRSDILAAGHRLVADEPESVGGSDAGPSPYDLLAAALAACTGMTLQVYARHKRLALERVTVRVRHDRIHAEDCENCETPSGKLDRFTRLIEPEGALDDAQNRKLVEIANKCPVHRTLESEVVIETRLAKQ